ncbi:MAG: DUF2905 domain-containing protein [bacterium]|nr:DUF2905 domain-containing protein [bacterium]
MLSISKIFIFLGGVFIISGALLFILHRLGLERLPGDIKIQHNNFTFYFPIVTCILLSVILSLILRFIKK